MASKSPEVIELEKQTAILQRIDERSAFTNTYLSTIAGYMPMMLSAIQDCSNDLIRIENMLDEHHNAVIERMDKTIGRQGTTHNLLAGLLYVVSAGGIEPDTTATAEYLKRYGYGVDTDGE